VLEQAAGLAGACWAEASAVANERHAAAEAVWAQEKKNLGLEISELVADLDKVSAEKDATVTELTARVTAAEARAETLQQAHDALLQRIVPETPDKDDRGQTNQ
jgi:hypothetical protein